MADVRGRAAWHSGSVSYQEFPPDPRLHTLVRTYWQMTEVHEVSEQEHRFMPERSVRLTFSAGHSWQGSPQGGPLERLPDATLFGLTVAPQRMVSVGLTRALGVELYPWGARQLFGWTFGQDLMDLTVQHPWLCRAVCALVRLDAWDEARQMVDDWLLGLMNERGRELKVGVEAARTLYMSLGQARIGTLSLDLGLSQRQLERAFLNEVGLNAKTLARIIRFEEAHNRLWLDPHASLSRLALDLGFSDQAHLTREFRSLAHMTPGTFARFTLQRLDQARRDELRAADPRLQPDRWTDQRDPDRVQIDFALIGI